MNFYDFLNQQALRRGKLFSSDYQQPDWTPKVDFLPKQHTGFTCNIETRKPLHYKSVCDDRALVSLALTKSNSETLLAYANKVPIMCINVSRFKYTREAFELQYPDSTDSALEFYLHTDILYERLRTPPTPQNLQFSNLLHRLQTNGYEEYIFELAKHLEFDVDLIVSSSDQEEKEHEHQPLLVFHYTFTGFPNKSRKNQLSGVITAVNNGKWYVKSTSLPIVART